MPGTNPRVVFEIIFNRTVCSSLILERKTNLMSIRSNQTAVLFDPENWTTNYHHLLLQIAISKVSDYQIAEDLVQDTFVSAWKARHNFRGECSEKTFLCGILRNKTIDYYRAKGRKPTVIASQIQTTDDSEDQNWLENYTNEKEVDPTLAVSREDFSKDLEHAVENLPEKMRKVFKLWMIEDLTTSEVTERLGISESNLWVTIHRAKKLLRTELETEWNANSLTV